MLYWVLGRWLFLSIGSGVMNLCLVSFMCQGNPIHLPAAGNCMLLKNNVFFSIPTWTCLILQPRRCVRSLVGSSPPAHAFSLRGRFSHHHPAARREKQCLLLKTLPSRHTRLGSRVGSHLPRRERAESQSPHGVIAGFVLLLRHFLRRLQSTCLWELSIIETNSPSMLPA